jgi:hypothetical protein
VTFRTHDDRRRSKFIVLADNMRAAINMAWEHGGGDFQSRFDKTAAQEQNERGSATGSLKHGQFLDYICKSARRCVALDGT